MRSGKRVLGKSNSHLRALRLMRAVCHREEETYPIVYRAEVWLFRIRAGLTGLHSLLSPVLLLALPVVLVRPAALPKKALEAPALLAAPAA